MPRFPKKRFKRRANGMSKVKKDIKWLKKNVEFKFKDQSLAGIDCNVAGVVTLLSGVARGTQRDQHVGEMLTARRIAIRARISNDQGNPEDCLVRLILVRKKNNNSLALTVAEVLEQTSDPSLSWASMDHARNLAVMWDQTFSMDLTQHSLIPLKLIYKLNHQVKFNESGFNATDIETNGIYLITLSDVVGTVNAPVIDFNIRYSFCDS